MTLKGHYDGQRVVLDDPVPDDIPAQTPVTITFASPRRETVFDRIAALAGPDDLPANYAEQHDHYVKGTPHK